MWLVNGPLFYNLSHFLGGKKIKQEMVSTYCQLLLALLLLTGMGREAGREELYYVQYVGMVFRFILNISFTMNHVTICSSRKYPYLNQGRRFFLPPPIWLSHLILRHLFNVFGVPPRNCQSLLQGLGEIMVFFFLEVHDKVSTVLGTILMLNNLLGVFF